MILVVLGTQDKQFTRLLDDVSREIELGHIKDEVIVQAGQTKYSSDKMKIFDFLCKIFHLRDKNFHKSFHNLLLTFFRMRGILKIRPARSLTSESGPPGSARRKKINFF